MQDSLQGEEERVGCNRKFSVSLPLTDLLLFTNKVAGQSCCLALVGRQSWQVSQLGVSGHGTLHQEILLAGLRRDTTCGHLTVSLWYSRCVAFRTCSQAVLTRLEMT